MIKKFFIIVLVVLILVVSKFWIGIYEHDEFNSKHIFLKHKPIWKTYFHSPRGMSDLELSDMTADEQKEQMLFDEFVLENLITP